MVFDRLANENEEQFLWRIGQAKDNGTLDMDWQDVADILNKEFRESESEYRSESAYRKAYQGAKRFYEAGVFRQYDKDAYISELRNVKHEIRQEKQKLFDERTSLNRVLREQGRVDSMCEIVKRAIEEYVSPKYECPEVHEFDSENDVIIHLTDIHCGVNISSPFNKFNSNILIERIYKYYCEIEKIQKLYNAQNAYVILGGDLIHGLIHVNSRIESKENVVNQIMTVSDLISEFVFYLSKIFCKVEIHTTVGNHSRSMPNKEEALHGEDFDLLIPFICKKALSRVSNVEFVDNYLDCDIATFKVRGHMVYATHGDKDTPKNIVYHMTQFARKAGMELPDICYLGHRHTNGLTTVDDVKVIESGCVDGMDNYTIEKRFTGTPEQTVVVVSEQHRIKALCDVQID